MSVYQAEGGENPSNSVGLTKLPRVVALQVYFPLTFFCIAPVRIAAMVGSPLALDGITASVHTCRISDVDTYARTRSKCRVLFDRFLSC